MIQVQTQEVGTGNWFTILACYPGNETQVERTLELVDVLRGQGLYARTVEGNTK